MRRARINASEYRPSFTAQSSASCKFCTSVKAHWAANLCSCLNSFQSNIFLILATFAISYFAKKKSHHHPNTSLYNLQMSSHQKLCKSLICLWINSTVVIHVLVITIVTMKWSTFHYKKPRKVRTSDALQNLQCNGIIPQSTSLFWHSFNKYRQRLLIMKCLLRLSALISKRLMKRYGCQLIKVGGNFCFLNQKTQKE